MCWYVGTRACTPAYLVKLSPGNHHVAEIAGEVGLVEDFLGQEVLVVLAELVLRLDLSDEFTVERVTHHPPGNTLGHHERHSVLMTSR